MEQQCTYKQEEIVLFSVTHTMGPDTITIRCIMILTALHPWQLFTHKHTLFWATPLPRQLKQGSVNASFIASIYVAGKYIAS